MGNIQNKAQKEWEKFEEKVLVLGRKSLGSNTDSETWS